MVDGRRRIPRDRDGAEAVDADGELLRRRGGEILERLRLEGLGCGSADGEVERLHFDLVSREFLQVAQDVGDGLRGWEKGWGV